MKIPDNTKIILGSGSPRRRELISKIFSEFEVVLPDCNEFSNETEPPMIVKDLAVQKGESVAKNVDENYSKQHNYLIIASDTLVEIEGQILGKPQSKDEAYQMLALLQNNWHCVWTGVCLYYISTNNSKTKNALVDRAKVHMISLNDKEINDYIATGSPMDKAGAYGIQDFNGKLIDKYEGDHDTIMGLPTIALEKQLQIMFSEK